ncbi:uncharacterized protein LOC128876855 isoform X2 [Hylaeus volcanicus]|nr:uncharacterized protein LOC128876855 isoform X2 [Hylaeus volcanicus]
MNNSEIVKASTRTVPNILKNNLKWHRTLVKVPIETHTALNTEQGAQVSLDNLRKKMVKTEVKCRSSTKRKQKYSFKDIWYELPNWDIHSFLDNKKKSLNKNLFPSAKLKASTQKQMLKHLTKRRHKKHDVSVCNTEQKKDLTSSISHDLSKEIIPEFRIFPASQKNDLNDLQIPIDFSSNEIFSEFNYESYGLSNLNYLTDYTISLDETHNSLSTTHDSDISEKKYDINGNELDIHETYLIQDKQSDEEVSPDQSLTSSEYWCKEVPIFSNKKFNFSSEFCCSHCLDDCVSNWVTTSEANNNIRMKNKVLSGISEKQSIISNNSIADQENFNCSNSHTTETYAYSTDDSLDGECSEQYSCSLMSETQTCFKSPLENIVITDLYGETDIQENISTETSNTVQQEECNELSNDNNVFSSEFDCDSRFRNSAEQGTNNNYTNILLTEENISYNKDKNGYQCLLCPISFSTARAMAMHQAGAHGGTYIIRCESCGRLFNQKYHFNRHFIHCGRLKEPYKCDMCIKIYRHKSSLTHHLKTAHHVHYSHNRSATFICTVCKKIYCKFGAFENHVKQHKTM